MIGLLRGFPGKPSHPPLTDVAIGGYTIGVIMLVLGALDVRESLTAVEFTGSVDRSRRR